MQIFVLLNSKKLKQKLYQSCKNQVFLYIGIAFEKSQILVSKPF